MFFSLIEILLVKVQYPPEEEYDTWTAGKKFVYSKTLIHHQYLLSQILALEFGNKPRVSHKENRRNKILGLWWHYHEVLQYIHDKVFILTCGICRQTCLYNIIHVSCPITVFKKT